MLPVDSEDPVSSVARFLSIPASLMTGKDLIRKSGTSVAH